MSKFYSFYLAVKGAMRGPDDQMRNDRRIAISFVLCQLAVACHPPQLAKGIRPHLKCAFGSEKISRKHVGKPCSGNLLQNPSIETLSVCQPQLPFTLLKNGKNSQFRAKLPFTDQTLNRFTCLALITECSALTFAMSGLSVNETDTSAHQLIGRRAS